ncbi:MAG: EamA family transporter [Pseudomonadota bacterium]
MELIWIAIAMIAGLMQAVRTAAQKSLNARLSTWMTTYVRSLFGLPVMLVYLWVVCQAEGLGAPDIPALYLFHCAMAAATQVVATYLLIVLFRLSNFAVGTMLTKTDIMQAALIGSVLFSEVISFTGWIAIALTFVGVILMSAGKTGRALRGGVLSAVFSRATLIGLTTGFLFCLSYLFLREASLVLEQDSTIWRGAWSVVFVTSMQVVALGLWLAASERGEFSKLSSVMRPCMFIGLTSAIGSIGWFTAMAMQNASYVKAVGQTEVIFTVLLSTLYFRERISVQEFVGIATIVAAIMLFVL